MADPFERDFGYLLPFFDKVEGAAASLEDPRAREELVALMREERDRWARIRELLGGTPGKAVESRAPVAVVPAVTPVRPPAKPVRAERPAGFTVGSLRVHRDEGGS
ncbi:MAG: hypothetical protein L0Y66_27730 [Myxococcaceae bacterium]|nr:hypothetical protein [Myxococcaceae bacterium]